MGGGGGRDFREQVRLDRLRETVRQTLAGTGRGHNVFVSFVAEDLAVVNALRAQAANPESNLAFRDWSVKEPFDSANADYLRRRIGERISHCSAVLVFVTEDTADSRWVNWEAEEGLRQGKKVFAMYAGERPPTRLPRVVSENSLAVVRWTHEGIMAQLEGS